MTSSAATVEEYLRSLPADRRAAISTVRATILAHLPAGYEERMGYGMIAYVVPHTLYPAGYHCDPQMPLMLASLGSQKHYMALYLLSVYGDPATEYWFRQAWTTAGNRLYMGKACVRFRKIEDVPLEVVGKVFTRLSVDDYIARTESFLATRPKAKAKPARKPAQ